MLQSSAGYLFNLKLQHAEGLTAALNVGVHHLRADAVGALFARRVLPEEALRQ